MLFFVLSPCKLCREPRGFGFVQYVEPADAEDAKYHMDGQILLGRELTVVFAEENRKKPQEMRQRERVRLVVVGPLNIFFGCMQSNALKPRNTTSFSHPNFILLY